MITEIPTISDFVKEVMYNGPRIIGYGCHAYGVYEYWSVLIEMLSNILSYTGEINIFIDEDPNKINKLSRSISRENPKLRMHSRYNFTDGPLKEYVGLKYDNVEFLNFVNVINNFNIKHGTSINIYGVNADYDDKKISQNITKIYNDRKRLSIYLGHVTNIQKIKLNRYRSVGYYLNKIFGKSYVAISTASMGGSIKFSGDHISGIEILARPLPLLFEDKGSLQRYVNNNINLVNNVIIFKITSELGYSFYYTGEVREPFTQSSNYALVDNLDYIIYIVKSSVVHDIYL